MYTAIRQAYATWLPDPPIGVVVDAGANMGDTAAWYLSRFPEARVIAVEPDPENFELLKVNCKPYGDRAALVQAALWSSETTLLLRPAAEKDGTSVSAQTGVGECRGISVPVLMREHGVTAIDILKCDIEGAELEVFSDGCDEWLSRTRCVVIETHGEACLQAVIAATRRQRFVHRAYRNLHFFHR